MSKLNKANIYDKLFFKKNLLLRTIRHHGQLGRLELARELHISNSRVCDLIQEMLDEGLLIEEYSGEERRGRRAVPIMVNPDFGHLVGFDWEAKRMRLITADFAGNIVWQDQAKLGKTKTRQELLDAMLEFIETGMKKHRANCKNILGIGLAGAGIVDIERGVILHYDLIDSARNLPLRDLVASKTSLPCFLEDNIRALTVAEWMSGAAQHFKNFFCLAVRSGVGAGIVINGKVYCGSHGFAGEAGLMPLPVGSSPNQWRFLHDIVSEKALDVDMEAKEFNLPESKAQRAGELLGIHLASLATFLDPQAIVLAGGLIQPDGPLFDPIVKTFRKCVLQDIVDRVQLLPARLGPFAAALGATHRCFQMLYPTEPTKA